MHKFGWNLRTFGRLIALVDRMDWFGHGPGRFVVWINRKRTQMKRLLQAAVLAVVCWGCMSGTALQAADEPPAPFVISGWSVDRVRKDVQGSNLVTARFTLKNNLSTDVSNLRIVIDYREMGESAKKTEPDAILRLKAGEEVEKSISQTYVPIFTDYLITVEYTTDGQKKTALLAGDSPIATPEPYSDEPIPGMAKIKMIGQTLTIERTWASGIEAIVRNFGELPAYGVQIEVTFMKDYNRRPTVMGTELVDFDTKGEVPGAKTVKAAMRFKKPYHGYDDYKVRLVQKDVPAEMSMKGASFLNRAEVEAGKWDFVRSNNGKDLVIKGSARNGMDAAVSDVTLVLNLACTASIPVKGSTLRKETKAENRTVKIKIDGKLEKGAVKEFATDVLKDFPRIDDLTTAFEFQLGDPPAAVAPAPAPASTTPEGIVPATVEAGSPAAPAAGGSVELIPDSVQGQEDGSVKIAVKVRNGTQEDVKGLKVVFTFTLANGGSKKAEMPLKGTLKAGKTASLNLSLPGIGAFTNYSYSIAYGG